MEQQNQNMQPDKKRHRVLVSKFSKEKAEHLLTVKPFENVNIKGGKEPYAYCLYHGAAYKYLGDVLSPVEMASESVKYLTREACEKFSKVIASGENIAVKVKSNEIIRDRLLDNQLNNMILQTERFR